MAFQHPGTNIQRDGIDYVYRIGNVVGMVFLAPVERRLDVVSNYQIDGIRDNGIDDPISSTQRKNANEEA